MTVEMSGCGKSPCGGRPSARQELQELQTRIRDRRSVRMAEVDPDRSLAARALCGAAIRAMVFQRADMLSHKLRGRRMKRQQYWD